MSLTSYRAAPPRVTEDGLTGIKHKKGRERPFERLAQKALTCEWVNP